MLSNQGVIRQQGDAMRGRKPQKLDLASGDVRVLEKLARKRTWPFYQVQRARVVLAVATGERVQAVAKRLECDPATVWRICQRYQTAGLAGLLEGPPRSGRPLVIPPPAASANCAVGVFGADC